MICGSAAIGSEMTIGEEAERSFLRRLVASISTSVSVLKLWTAPRYPTRFWWYLGEDMTSRT